MGLKSFVLHPPGAQHPQRGGGAFGWELERAPLRGLPRPTLEDCPLPHEDGGRVQGEPRQNRPDAFIGVVFPGLRSCWVFCSEQARCTMGWGRRTNILAVVGLSQASWGTSTRQVANNATYTTGTDTR